MTGVRSITPAERDNLISQYDGAIAYVDSNLGVLILELKRLGVFDNTLIVIASDHGEAFGERNLMEHWVSVYQNQVHVALVIKYPHQRQQRLVATRVSQVDVLPTVLRSVGLNVPPGVEGRSLQEPGARADRAILSESFSRGAEFNHRLDRLERALFVGNMKLIVSTTGKRELYDLAQDPGETRNLFGRDDQVSGALVKRLATWLKQIPPSRSGERKSDADTLRLRSLGYMQ